jgi:hypothetical protein
MRGTVAVILAFGLMIPFPAPAAGDGDFKAVVRSIESNFGARRMRIPMFGFARFFINVARPAGVRNLDLAIFENLHISSNRFQDLDDAVRGAAGGRWQPMVRVRERNEWVCIYARPDGKNDMRLLIATIEQDETVLVHVKVRPETLARILDEDPRRTPCLGGSEDRCVD